VRKHFVGHDWVVIVTDEQSATAVGQALSREMPL
jgi:hypothetical protein